MGSHGSRYRLERRRGHLQPVRVVVRGGSGREHVQCRGMACRDPCHVDGGLGPAASGNRSGRREDERVPSPGMAAVVGLGVLFVSHVHRPGAWRSGSPPRPSGCRHPALRFRPAGCGRSPKSVTAGRDRRADRPRQQAQALPRIRDFFENPVSTLRCEQNLAFLFVDLDHFKEIND